MDEMNILLGKGTGDDPQALMRDPVGWRAAVFGRLGTAVIKTTFIGQHQLEETAFLRRQLSHLHCEEKALTFIRTAPIDSTVTTQRGTAIRKSAAVPGKPAALSPRPKSLSQLWDEWMKGIDGQLPAKDFTSTQRGEDKIKHVFSLHKPFWSRVK